MSDKKNELLEMLTELTPGKLTPGQVMRAKRKNFGITLEEIEEATGISQSNLSLYENDRKAIGYVQATKIGLAIGLHPMTILFPNGIEKDKRFIDVVKKAQKLLKRKLAQKKAVS